MSKRLALFLVASLISGLSTLLPEPARADGATCAWKVGYLPAHYRIGIDKLSPAASTPYASSQQGVSCIVADNWHLTALVKNSSSTTIGTLRFSGCSNSAWDAATQKCAEIGNGTNGEYTPVAYIRWNLTLIGTFTTVQDGASYARNYGDVNGYTLQFTSTQFTSKLATKTSLAVTRSGTLRTFTIRPRHYSVAAKAFVASINQYVALQRYVAGTWKTYATVKSSTSTITYKHSFSSSYNWRAYTPATTTRWGSLSISVTN
jgi:hypothetical protein